MSQNCYVFDRLAGIQKQLMAGYQASAPLSTAAKGAEREMFIDKFLSQVLPTPFRFGTGDATDKNGAKSGQLDVVIEFPFGPSLPSVGGATTRLFLAETVAAVIEVKSNIISQWSEALRTAKQLLPLERSYGGSITSGPSLPKIPLFIASFTGWKQPQTVEKKLNSSDGISGILVIDPGVFVSSQDFGSIRATGAWALWGLITCLHRATGFLKVVSTNPLEYAK